LHFFIGSLFQKAIKWKMIDRLTSTIAATTRVNKIGASEWPAHLEGMKCLSPYPEKMNGARKL
jgi:hypothetical protein